MFLAKYNRILEPVKRYIQLQVDMEEKVKFTGMMDYFMTCKEQG